MLVQARHCAGHFFDGIHAAGRHAHGVYEGSYWQLLADAEELKAMLTRMAKAPPLMAEPALVLPPPLELPSWDEFKPVLQPVPDTVHMPELVLPPFVKPPLLVRRPWRQTTIYRSVCKPWSLRVQRSITTRPNTSQRNHGDKERNKTHNLQ